MLSYDDFLRDDSARTDRAESLLEAIEKFDVGREYKGPYHAGYTHGAAGFELLPEQLTEYNDGWRDGRDTAIAKAAT